MQLDGKTPLNLTLTLDMVNIVLAALSTQSYERVAGIIAAIQQQAAPQISIPQGTAAPAAQEAKPE